MLERIIASDNFLIYNKTPIKSFIATDIIVSANEKLLHFKHTGYNVSDIIVSAVKNYLVTDIIVCFNVNNFYVNVSTHWLNVTNNYIICKL